MDRGAGGRLHVRSRRAACTAVHVLASSTISMPIQCGASSVGALTIGAGRVRVGMRTRIPSVPIQWTSVA